MRIEDVKWPHSHDSEAYVLGCMLHDDRTVGELLCALSPEDFFIPAHGVVFRHMAKIAGDGKPCEYGLLIDSLASSRDAESYGGDVYVLQLMERIVGTGAFLEHAQIVKDHAISRRIMQAGVKLLKDADAGVLSGAELASHASELIYSSCATTASASAKSMADVSASALEIARRAVNSCRAGEMTGIPSHLSELDKVVGGFRPGELTVLAANSSIGKTAFALEIVRKNARVGVPCGIFSMEMTSESLALRHFAAESLVPLTAIRRGSASDVEVRQIEYAAGMVGKFPVIVDDAPGLSAADIAVRARMMKMRLPGMKFLVIDGLWLMRHVGDRGLSEAARIGETMKGLCAMAKDLGVHVFLLHQLSRDNEKRSGATDTMCARPKLADLRSSGDVEQSPDIVIFLWRERVADANVKNIETKALVAKNRNGALADIPLMFFPQTQTFRNAEWMDRD